MKSLLQLDLIALRFAALVGAMLVYALAGSPSPDQPGFIELVTGLLLILAVGFARLRNLFIFSKHDEFWIRAGKILFIYGASLVILTGILNGNDLRLMLRDLPPFLFLMLPLLCMDIFEKRPAYYDVFLFVFAIMGGLFAWRGLGEASIFNPSLNTDTRELYYFANAPSVLFAAVFPLGWALANYTQTLSIRSACLLMAALAFICLPIAAMAITLQRASLGWVCVSYVTFIALGLWRAPYRVLSLLPLAALIIIVIRTSFTDVLQHLQHKTAVYGVNKRGMEIAAVWRDISASPISMIFGLGWGGSFESPAVAGTRVNFTHSFVSGMLLKSGIIGLLAAAGYTAGFFTRAARLAPRNIILCMALAGPLVIDVFLYASYKWLDFGILLTVIATAPVVAKRA